MDDVALAIPIMGILFVVFPWIIFHYVTKWKTAATITNEDEHLLDELYRMARRLDERMDTIERLVDADNPDWKRQALPQPDPKATLERFEEKFDETLSKERR